jgi:hypothetical protein
MKSALFSFIFGGSYDDSGMAETKTFRIKYDGEALADHTIDVNELAPALMALGDLIQEANSLANQDRSSVSIKVKATETGCFQISIQAIQTLADDAVTLLAGQQFTALANLLQILGFAGMSGATILWLIKKLGNKPPKSISENEGRIEIDTGSGAVTISKLQWEMYQSRKIRKSIYGILKPLEKAGVEMVEFIDVESNVVATTVQKSELQLFIPPEEKPEPLQELPIRETYVNVVHMWFKDGNKWKFSEGESEWPAEMKDQNFLVKLLKGETSIHANDFLKVKVKQVQYREGASVKSTYEIIEVLEHTRSPKQTLLM